jgi:hypothetical protein
MVCVDLQSEPIAATCSPGDARRKIPVALGPCQAEFLNSRRPDLLCHRSVCRRAQTATHEGCRGRCKTMGVSASLHPEVGELAVDGRVKIIRRWYRRAHPSTEITGRNLRAIPRIRPRCSFEPSRSIPQVFHWNHERWSTIASRFTHPMARTSSPLAEHRRSPRRNPMARREACTTPTWAQRPAFPAAIRSVAT